MSRTLSGLFLLSASNRPRKRKRTNREIPKQSLDKLEKFEKIGKVPRRPPEYSSNLCPPKHLLQDVWGGVLGLLPVVFFLQGSKHPPKSHIASVLGGHRLDEKNSGGRLVPKSTQKAGQVWARAQGYCKMGSGGQRKIEKLRATFNYSKNQLLPKSSNYHSKR